MQTKSALQKNFTAETRRKELSSMSSASHHDGGGLSLAALNMHDSQTQADFEHDTVDRHMRIRRDQQTQQVRKQLPGYLTGASAGDSVGSLILSRRRSLPATTTSSGGRGTSATARTQGLQKTKSPSLSPRSRRRGSDTPILSGFSPPAAPAAARSSSLSSPGSFSPRRGQQSSSSSPQLQQQQSSGDKLSVTFLHQHQLQPPSPTGRSDGWGSRSSSNASKQRRRQQQQHENIFMAAHRAVTPPPIVQTTNAFKLRQKAMATLVKKLDGPAEFDSALVPKPKPSKKKNPLTTIDNDDNSNGRIVSLEQMAAAAAAGAAATEGNRGLPKFSIRSEASKKPTAVLAPEHEPAIVAAAASGTGKLLPSESASSMNSSKTTVETATAAELEERNRYWNRLARPDPAAVARTAREGREVFRKQHTFSPALSKRTRSGTHTRLSTPPATSRRSPALTSGDKPVHSVYHDLFSGQHNEEAEKAKSNNNSNQKSSGVRSPDRGLTPTFSFKRVDSFTSSSGSVLSQGSASRRRNSVAGLPRQGSFAGAMPKAKSFVGLPTALTRRSNASVSVSNDSMLTSRSLLTPSASGMFSLPHGDGDDDNIGPPPEDDEGGPPPPMPRAAAVGAASAAAAGSSSSSSKAVPLTAQQRRELEQKREAQRFTTVRAPFHDITPSQRKKQAEREAAAAAEAALFQPSVTKKAATINRTVEHLQRWLHEKQLRSHEAEEKHAGDADKEFMESCSFAPGMDSKSDYIVHSLGDRRINVEDHALMTSRTRAEAAQREAARRQQDKQRDLKWVATQQALETQALQELRATGSTVEDRKLAAKLLAEKQAAKKAQQQQQKLRICDVRRDFFSKVFEDAY